MTLWHYLLLLNLYLILFFGFYSLFLRKETFFQLNRVYLVSGALLSFLIPLIQSQWIKDLFITKQVHQTLYVVNPVQLYNIKPIDHHPATLGNILTWVYACVALILIVRLVLRLMSLKKLVERMEASAAFSFFNKIRVDQSLPSQQTIIEHEQVHVKQWHSADILFIELVMIINWFNPIVYFYRKAIKHVHEFIADKKALQSGTSKTEYALLLLSQTFGTNTHQLTNNFFNQSLLKRRILMLHKNESKRRALLKYGLSAPLFGTMLILSSATVNENRLTKAIYKNTERVFLINTNTLVKGGTASHNTFGANILKHFIKIEVNKQANKPNGILTNAVVANATPATNSESPVFTAVEESPIFPGGEANFYSFIRQQLRYPAEALQNKIQGRVFINFVVEDDGSLSNIKVLREPGYGLGDEAARVLGLSPKWKPGVQNGHYVRVSYTVPINFSINNGSEKRKIIFKDSLINSKEAKDDTANKKRVFILGGVARKATGLPNQDLGGNNTYFINGQKVSSIGHIDPQTIKSIQVFKNYLHKPDVNDTVKHGIVLIRLKDEATN